MKNWPKVMELSDQSWSFTSIFKFTKFIFFCHVSEIVQQSRKSAFSYIFRKTSPIESGKRDGHGKSRNGHGKDAEKYFVKSVGTLINGQE